MLDVFSISDSLFNRITNCGTTPKGIDITDHTATKIKINLNTVAYKRHGVKTLPLWEGKTDWRNIILDPTLNHEYNAKITDSLSHIPTQSYSDFFLTVNKAACSTATTINRPPSDWF